MGINFKKLEDMFKIVHPLKQIILNLLIKTQHIKTETNYQYKFRKCITITLLLISTNTFAQENDLSKLHKKELQNSIRLNFTTVDMPNHIFPNLEDKMGLMSLDYNVLLNEWFYIGSGMKAALTGDQGGLFTLGIETGISKKLYRNLYFDTNIYFGGGGGYRYLVNDGGLINPNIGIKLKNKNNSIGLQYSYVNFYSGEIKSNSISFFAEVPITLRMANYKEALKTFIAKDDESAKFWNTPATKTAQQIRFDFLSPIGNSKRDNGLPIEETLYTIGFEYQKYINKQMYAFVHTDAIYKGLRAGFMDLFFGFGRNLTEDKLFNLFYKLGIGAAGGRIAPEGGLMIYPSAGMDIKISKSFLLSTHGGFYHALDGDLQAYTTGFGIKYVGLNGGIHFEKGNFYKQYKTKGIRVTAENQTYFDVLKTDAPKATLQMLALKLNYDLSKHIYTTSEASFAYDGESGGYAHGLIGFGVKSPTFLKGKLEIFSEISGGAAGGAGIDTGEGIVIKPLIGMSYFHTNTFALSASRGRIIAPFGNIDSTNINIGINFRLSILNAIL